jgi:hypothetical protein
LVEELVQELVFFDDEVIVELGSDPAVGETASVQ